MCLISKTAMCGFTYIAMQLEIQDILIGYIISEKK